MKPFKSGGFNRGPLPPRGPRGPRFQQHTNDAHRINDRIRATQIRVVSETGEQLGLMTPQDAMRIAETSGLDLVEVAPEAKPPVCKIMDYGKFKYREQKKLNDAKKKRTEVQIKELRLRYSTDKGDLETKLNHAKEFLAEGNKVKFSMRFRGREVAYLDLGLQKFKQIAEALKEFAAIDEESPPRGKQIYIIFAPSKKQ